MSSGQGGAAASFTDLMASLVAVFVLLFVVAQNNRGVGLQDSRDALIKQLRGELKQAGIDSAAVDSVPNDRSTVVIILPDSVLFDRGADSMSSAGQSVVREATPALARVLCSSDTREKLDQIVVEGHTDNTIPLNRTPQSGRQFNLALSQRRSMDFVLKSTAALVSDEDALGCYLNLVSASGRGQEDSLRGVPGDAAEQRRVVLRIRLRTDDRDTLRLGVSADRK